MDEISSIVKNILFDKMELQKETPDRSIKYDFIDKVVERINFSCKKILEKYIQEIVRGSLGTNLNKKTNDLTYLDIKVKIQEYINELEDFNIQNCNVIENIPELENYIIKKVKNRSNLEEVSKKIIEIIATDDLMKDIQTKKLSNVAPSNIKSKGEQLSDIENVEFENYVINLYNEIYNHRRFIEIKKQVEQDCNEKIEKMDRFADLALYYKIVDLSRNQIVGKTPENNSDYSIIYNYFYKVIKNNKEIWAIIDTYIRCYAKGITDGSYAVCNEYSTNYAGNALSIPKKTKYGLDYINDYTSMYNYSFNSEWNKTRSSIISTENQAKNYNRKIENGEKIITKSNSHDVPVESSEEIIVEPEIINVEDVSNSHDYSVPIESSEKIIIEPEIIEIINIKDILNKDVSSYSTYVDEYGKKTR